MDFRAMQAEHTTLSHELRTLAAGTAAHKRTAARVAELDARLRPITEARALVAKRGPVETAALIAR